MHWGRKKGPTTTTVVRTSSSKDHDQKLILKSKKVSELSNDELQALSRRFQLEKQFKEIKKSEISTGRKLIGKVIDSATKGATDMTLNYVNKQAAKMVEELIKKSTKAAT